MLTHYRNTADRTWQDIWLVNGVCKSYMRLTIEVFVLRPVQPFQLACRGHIQQVSNDQLRLRSRRKGRTPLSVRRVVEALQCVEADAAKNDIEEVEVTQHRSCVLVVVVDVGSKASEFSASTSASSDQANVLGWSALWHII